MLLNLSAEAGLFSRKKKPEPVYSWTLEKFVFGQFAIIGNYKLLP